MLYSKRQEERALELRKAKVLADDSVTGGFWNDTKLLVRSRQEAARRLGFEIPADKVSWGDRQNCQALGYTVTPNSATLPEGQLLAGLLWPERSYPMTTGRLGDNVERCELIATRAHGYQLTPQGHYEKFSRFCELGNPLQILQEFCIALIEQRKTPWWFRVYRDYITYLLHIGTIVNH